jgi:hypothetical protein
MPHPLIIFGAGASYDYSLLGKIAPLTKQLVDNEFLHSDLLEKYTGSGDLLSEIIHQVRANNRNFEEVLAEIKERTKDSQQMRAHFVALEFYLKELFKRISLKKQAINNYKALINHINTYSNGKALVVSFNYDSLFEDSLLSGKPKKMDDYTTGNIKIFKLHGSHDWTYIHRFSELERKHLGIKDYGIGGGFDFCLKNPDFLEQIKKKEGYEYPPIHEKEFEDEKERSDFFQFPAIAMPLTGKDSYISPPNHNKKLEQGLSEVDRILIIGWRAGDPLLLKTLKNHLPAMGYKIFIISNTKDSAEKIADTVKKALGITYGGVVFARGGGFSGFIASDTPTKFFTE